MFRITIEKKCQKIDKEKEAYKRQAFLLSNLMILVVIVSFGVSAVCCLLYRLDAVKAKYWKDKYEKDVCHCFVDDCLHAVRWILIVYMILTSIN